MDDSQKTQRRFLIGIVSVALVLSIGACLAFTPAPGLLVLLWS